MNGYDNWKLHDTDAERAEELAEAQEAAREHERRIRKLNHMGAFKLRRLLEQRQREYGGIALGYDENATRQELVAAILIVEAAIERERAGEPV